MAPSKSTVAAQRSPRRSIVALLIGVGTSAMHGLTTQPALAQPSKTIYIACDDHTDWFWTASEATYRISFANQLDYYLDLKDATAGNAPDFQSRFNCDGSMWAYFYQQDRPAAQFDRFISQVRSGHMTVPLNPLVVLHGGMPAEAVLRGMYYAGTLERQYNLDLPLVISMENQVLPSGGLASLWAGSGARYSWRGICDCVTRTPNAANREHDAYWYTGPDGQRVLMKWNSLLVSNTSLGGYAEARDIPSVVDFATNNPTFQSRWPYETIGIFGKGWDDLETFTSEFPTQAQALSNANRRVVVSNEVDFFRDFEARHGATLANIDYSYGNEWELYSASMAETTAQVRRSMDKLRSAESLAVLASSIDEAFMASHTPGRTRAQLDMSVYHEHDWTGDGPVPRAERAQFQLDCASRIASYVDGLQTAAIGQVGSAITPLSGTIPAELKQIAVYNPLSFVRTDAVDVPLSSLGASITLTTPLTVYDDTGVQLPSQTLTSPVPSASAPVPSLRFIASSLPSMGYRTYRIVQAPPLTAPAAATITGGNPTPATITHTYTITANNRDAMSNSDGNGGHTVRLSGYAPGERVDFISSDSDEQTSALSFTLDVPIGRTVSDARLIVRGTPSQSVSPTGALAIRAFAVDDCPPFIDAQPIDLQAFQPLASTSVTWPVPSWPIDNDATSPNLSPLIQQYITRPGYAPGKHLGLVISRGTIEANRYVGFYDSASGQQAARLAVTYSDPTGNPAPSDTLTIENALVSITLHKRGAITSIIDKASGNRQLASVIGGLACNDLGSDGPGTVSVESTGPASVTILATCSAAPSREVRVTLYANSDRIDIANRITQNFADIQHWAYAFNVSNPITRHEEVGAICLAKPRTSAGGSYATQSARLDYLSLNHFVDMANGVAGSPFGVILANADLQFMQLGQPSSIGALDTTTPLIKVLAGGNVDGPSLGMIAQNGQSSFTQRFALRPRAAYDQAEAMRFGLRRSNPLVPIVLTRGGATTLPSSNYSMLSTGNPDVLLWQLKPAEDGITPLTSPPPGSSPTRGVVARTWNLAEGPRTADITLNLPGRAPVTQARLTTHIETDRGPATVAAGAVSLSHERQQVRTIAMTLPPRTGTIPPCIADIVPDGVVDGSDFVAFINSFALGDVTLDPAADINADGTIDGNDFVAFINSFALGC